MADAPQPRPTPPSAPRPSRPLITTLRPSVTEDTVARVADVLAEAFAEDPYTLATLPASRRPERLREHFAGVVRDLLRTEPGTEAPRGVVDVAVDAADGTLLAAALWSRPESPTGAPLPTLLSAAPTALRINGRHALNRLRTLAACDRARPRVPHWYLMDLGTVPAARGRGAARVLVERRQRTAAEAGVGIYLESATRATVPYYERLGFETRWDVPAPGAAEPLTGMWWEA